MKCNKRKNYISVVISLLLCMSFLVRSYAQSLPSEEGFVCGTPYENLQTGNPGASYFCQFPSQGTKYWRKQNYIPEDMNQTPEKTIRLVFQVLFNPNLPNNHPAKNFSGTPAHTRFLREVFIYAQSFIAGYFPPTDPIPGVAEITQRRINIELVGINYVPTPTPNKTNISELFDLGFGNQPETILNVFWSTGFLDDEFQDADGAAIYPYGDLDKRLGILMTGKTWERFLAFCPTNIPCCGGAPQITDQLPCPNGILPCVENCDNKKFIAGMVLAHELAHCLGLAHTYDNVCPPFNSTPEQIFSHLDQVDNFHSDIFYNPADVNEYLKCPHNSAWLEPTGPIFQGDPVDFNDPTHTNNLMGGSKLQGYLSPQQVGLIHRNLSLTAARKYVKNSPYAPGEPLSTFIISQDELWTMNIRVYNDIIVKTGTTLTIRCEVHFSNNARLIVEPGARLIVDEDVLTNSTDGLWAGIIVNPGTATLPDGFVELKDNAVIEHANIGVVLQARGGRLVASNSSFRNCPIGISTTNLIPEVEWTNSPPSTVKNCTFTWDDNLRWSFITTTNPRPSLVHIQTQSRTGFNVINSTFTSEFTTLQPNVSRRGIVANSSEVGIFSNTFRSLSNGIHYLNSGYSFSPNFEITNNILLACDSGGRLV